MRRHVKCGHTLSGKYFKCVVQTTDAFARRLGAVAFTLFTDHLVKSQGLLCTDVWAVLSVSVGDYGSFQDRLMCNCVRGDHCCVFGVVMLYSCVLHREQVVISLLMYGYQMLLVAVSIGERRASLEPHLWPIVLLHELWLCVRSLLVYAANVIDACEKYVDDSAAPEE